MTASTLSSFQISLNDATWIDVNTLFTINNLPDRLPDAYAIIHGSLTNLFNCPIGARSRIFQPTYGMLWKEFLQEPLDQITANKMQIGLIQALTRWEPRLNISIQDTTVTPDFSLPGYQVRLAFSLGLTSQKQAVAFSVPI